MGIPLYIIDVEILNLKIWYAYCEMLNKLKKAVEEYNRELGEQLDYAKNATRHSTMVNIEPTKMANPTLFDKFFAPPMYG